MASFAFPDELRRINRLLTSAGESGGRPKDEKTEKSVFKDDGRAVARVRRNVFVASDFLATHLDVSQDA